MSTLGIAALVVAAIWVAALSLVVVLLVRQVGLLTLRADQADAGPSLDGLSVGSEVPEVLRPIVADAPGLVHLLVLGSDCGPCRALVEGVRDREVLADVIAVVTGDPARALAVAEELPGTFASVLPPRAEAIQASLNLQTTPFLFAIDSNVIVDKTTVKGVDHFISKVTPPAPLDPTIIEVTNA
jgi:hypothetical protein